MNVQGLVDLEQALSSPGLPFKQLIAKWRLLPATGEAPKRSTSPRRPQRVEDRLGSEGVARLCADYQSGVPTTHLVRTFGLSKGPVLRILEARGVPRRRHGLTKADTQKAIELYTNGHSLASIGELLGYSHTTVLRALRAAGVRIRPRRGWNY